MSPKVKDSSTVISKKKSTTSKRKPATASKASRKKKVKTEGDEENEEEMIESEQEENEDEEEVEDEEMMDETTTEIENKENNQTDSIQSVLIDLDKLWMHFREFDLSVVNFLTLDIELVEMVPDTAATNNRSAATQVVRLKPHLFYAVISDFNQKLALILKTTGSSAPRAPGFGVGATSTKPSKTKLFLARSSTRPYELVSFNCS